MDSIEWDQPNWIFAPDVFLIDDDGNHTATAHVDYQPERACRLFSTIESRMARCITHFDNLSLDERLIFSVRSEMNFLRAVWGEVRHATGILPPNSPLLRLLQSCLDRNLWSSSDQLKELATQQRLDPSSPMLESSEFPVEDWWDELPSDASAVPPTWQGFDMGDAIIGISIRSIEADVIEDFEDDIRTLANDLALLQEDIRSSSSRVEFMETQLASSLNSNLHAPGAQR